jgi:hypothetical protein
LLFLATLPFAKNVFFYFIFGLSLTARFLIMKMMLSSSERECANLFGDDLNQAVKNFEATIMDRVSSHSPAPCRAVALDSDDYYYSSFHETPRTPIECSHLYDSHIETTSRRKRRATTMPINIFQTPELKNTSCGNNWLPSLTPPLMANPVMASNKKRRSLFRDDFIENGKALLLNSSNSTKGTTTTLRQSRVVLNPVSYEERLDQLAIKKKRSPPRYSKAIEPQEKTDSFPLPRIPFSVGRSSNAHRRISLKPRQKLKRMNVSQLCDVNDTIAHSNLIMPFL